MLLPGFPTKSVFILTRALPKRLALAASSTASIIILGRISAPRSWPIEKKTHKWVVNTNPGPRRR
nr:hypothetical protein [Anaerolineae bacterium]